MSNAGILSPNPEGRGGWRSSLPLVAAGFVISLVVIGGGIDTVGVFINAIARTTDWSRSALSVGVGVGAVTAALSIPLVGAAVDRFGVRVPMLVGVVLLTAAFAVVSNMTESWHFAAANVLFGAGFAACALLPLTIAIAVCIPEGTGLALGIAAAGSSAGTLIFAPLLQASIDAVGWRWTYALMGAVVVATPLPFLAFALPRGRLRRQDADAATKATGRLIDELRRPGVAPLAAMMVLPGFAGFSVSVHLVPYLTGIGHAATTAAAALGAAVGVSAVGKVAGGYIADRFGPLNTLKCALVVSVVSLVLLARAASPVSLGIFVPLYGLALGAQVAVVPALAILIFGPERFGTLFGVMQLGAMLASAVGPVVSGILFDRSGGYASSIAMWTVAMAIAAVVAWTMRVAEAVPAGEVVT